MKWPTLPVYCPIVHEVSAPQTAFLVLDCMEALYGGAVGGGKTAALLMAASQYVDVPGYAALILRRTFPELEQPDGPIEQSLRWFAQAPENRRPVYNQTEHEWKFPSGAVIRFGHLDHPNAMIRYQGGGYHFFGFDELTHFDQRSYEFIGLSRTRRPARGPLSKVPMRIRATANPGGPGHGWVKSRFISDRKPGVVFVPARLADNPGIDQADYISRLEKLGPTLRQQLLDGDWGAFEGAAFTVTDAHLVDGFQPDEQMERFEAADYGLNGAPWCSIVVDYDGNLVVRDMLYERQKLPSEIAPLVLAKRATWGEPTVAIVDKNVWRKTGARNRWGDPAMLSDEFTDNGLMIEPSNSDPRAGLIRVRELLACSPERRFPDWHHRAGEPGAPRLFFDRQRCAQLVTELQSAPLQPVDRRDAGEIVDPDWESKDGHAVAMLRYAVMSRPAPSDRPYEPLDDPRAEFARQLETKRDDPPRYQWT